MKEAGSSAAAHRTGRGYGGPPAGGGKGGSMGGSDVAARKAVPGKEPCFDCGGGDHWAGDPQCKTPGQGLSRKPGGKAGGAPRGRGGGGGRGRPAGRGGRGGGRGNRSVRFSEAGDGAQEESQEDYDIQVAEAETHQRPESLLVLEEDAGWIEGSAEFNDVQVAERVYEDVEVADHIIFGNCPEPPADLLSGEDCRCRGPLWCDPVCVCEPEVSGAAPSLDENDLLHRMYEETGGIWVEGEYVPYDALDDATFYNEDGTHQEEDNEPVAEDELPAPPQDPSGSGELSGRVWAKYEQPRQLEKPLRVPGSERFVFGSAAPSGSDADNASADFVAANGNGGDVSLLFMDCASPFVRTLTGYDFMTETATTLLEHDCYTTVDKPPASLPALLAALDSACNRSVAGVQWMSRCYARVKQCGLLLHWNTLPDRETFRFGSGHRLVSTLRCRMPLCVRGVPLYVWCSTVDSPTLGLLLGKDFLRGVGLRLDYMGGLGDFRRFGSPALSGISLKEMQGGHYALPLSLETFSAPTGASVVWTAFDSKGTLSVDDRQCVVELCLNHLRPGSIRGSAAKRPRLGLRELAEANDSALQSTRPQSALRAAQVSISELSWRPSSSSRTRLRRLGAAADNMSYLCTAEHQALTTAAFSKSCEYFDFTQELCNGTEKQFAATESDCIAGDSTGAASAATATAGATAEPFGISALCPRSCFEIEEMSASAVTACEFSSCEFALFGYSAVPYGGLSGASRWRQRE